MRPEVVSCLNMTINTTPDMSGGCMNRELYCNSKKNLNLLNLPKIQKEKTVGSFLTTKNVTSH